jgi:predicted SnoaL-like aldol condensation-catalyzing enzyme
MGTEENKAVVRRWMHEILRDGNLEIIDEVLAPDYVNLAMGGADREGAKAVVAGTHGAMKGQRFEGEELVAEGDAVFARFTYLVTVPDGSTTSFRTMAYYRIVDGKIAVNDVMSDPNMMGVLGPLLASD